MCNIILLIECVVEMKKEKKKMRMRMRKKGVKQGHIIEYILNLLVVRLFRVISYTI